MSKPLDKILSALAKISDDPSKMLIWTGIIGWGMSSFAQMLGILFNPKVEKEQKSYLLAQEAWDAVANVGAFFAITQLS